MDNVNTPNLVEGLLSTGITQEVANFEDSEPIRYTSMGEEGEITDVEDWMIIQANSISGLTQNSKKHDSKVRISKSDITGVTPAKFKKVKSRVYKTYIAEIEEVFKEYQTLANDNVNKVEESTDTGRLDSIPDIFFSPDFNLENTEIFTKVFEMIGKVEIGAEGMINAEDEKEVEKQEKISKYLNIVENEINKEVEKRSGSFFGVLSTLQKLQAETQECVSEIKKVLGNVREYKETKEKKREKTVMGLVKRKTNVLECLKYAKVVEETINTLPVIEEMVMNGDSANALLLVSELEKIVMSNSISPKSNIYGYTIKQLKRAMESVSDTGLSGLVTMLEEGLVTYVESEGRAEISFNSILSLLCGLERIGIATQGINEFCSRIMDTIGTLVEDYYPEGFPKSGNGVDFNDAEVQQKLSQCVKAMTLDSYLYLFGKQSHALVLVNGYIQEISNLGAKVNEQNKMVTTSPELISAIRELGDVAQEAGDMRITKLLNFRRDQISRLPLASFTALLEMTTDYVEKMEKLRGKMSNNIKGQMIKVGKIYMGNYLVEKSRQINVIVENEQWNHVDAPKDYQELLDSLVSCSEANSVELENTQTTAKYLPLTSVTTKVSPTPQKSPMNRPSLNKLKIGESTFSMVGSSLTLLKIVYEYLQIALHVSFLFTQAVSDTSIIFKQFNSKVCQVVLGAGAVASAGLKVISAKHISLATNALDFALEVINLAQTILSNAAPSYKKLISDSFDLITFDYISHREELLKKLLSIMSERAKSHATALSNTDYDHLSSSPSSTALGITKELKRLYKILFRYLKYSDCVSTFRSIITEFDSTFQSCFEGDIQVTTAAGKLNIINDLRFINFELENLPGVPTLSDMLEITVNNINLVTDFLPSFSDQLYDEYLEYEAGYHPEVQGIDYIDIDSETTHSPSVDNSPYFP